MLIGRSCGALLTVDFGKTGKRGVNYGEGETAGERERE